ncbi:hypothetical protein J7E62_31895 [Variovorax paradoxus]|nr:hypothetical protein [Variovorax paradoxus]
MDIARLRRTSFVDLGSMLDATMEAAAGPPALNPAELKRTYNRATATLIRSIASDLLQEWGDREEKPKSRPGSAAAQKPKFARAYGTIDEGSAACSLDFRERAP